MHRMQTFIHHLNASTVNVPKANSSLTSNIYNIDCTFKISDEYECRFIRNDDYNDIIELCQDIHGGVDFVPERFYEYFIDDKTLFVGVEYTPESKIIATRIIKIIDDGITAFSMGGRIHSKHRAKKLFVPFSKWHNNIAQKLFPTLKRRRAVIDSHNKTPLDFQRKHFGEIPIPNFDGLICVHIKYGEVKSGEFRENFIISPQHFEGLLTENIDKEFDNKSQFELVDNAEFIADLLINKFNKKHVILDTDTVVFDLSIAKKGVYDTLNKLNIWVNAKHSAVGMVYTDRKQQLTEFFIYGLINDPMSILVMVYWLFKRWKKEKDQLIVNDDCVLQIWIDEEIVKNNVIINKLCKGCDSLLVIQKLL